MIKNTKTIDEKEFARQLREAKKRGEENSKLEPRAVSVKHENGGSIRSASGLQLEAFIPGGLVSVRHFRGGPGKIVVRNAAVFCKKLFQTVAAVWPNGEGPLTRPLGRREKREALTRASRLPNRRAKKRLSL